MMLASIKQFCDTQQLLKPHMKVIVGLSGGPDSVFLLHMLVQLKQYYHGLELIVAHLDHGWRAESAYEALWCKDLAESLSLTFISKRAEDISIAKKAQGKEDLGRLLRRAFFEQLAVDYHADAIALGQHADDQQETFFIRLIRGAGLSGLASIRPKHGLYIRPLLGIDKKTILHYLDAHALTYQVDATNSSPEFLRNRIRSEITPALRAIDSRFAGNFEKTIQHLQNTDAYLEKHTQVLLNSVSVQMENRIELNIAALLALDEFMHQRIILAWLIAHTVQFPLSSNFFQELLNFLKKRDPGIYSQPTWRIEKKKKRAYIISI